MSSTLATKIIKKIDIDTLRYDEEYDINEKDMTTILYIALFLGLFAVKKVSMRTQIILSLTLGIFSLLLATWWIHPSYHDFKYFESDFLDYCYTLTTYDQPLNQNGSAHRSRFAGLSSFFLKDAFGTIDAIAVSSLIWTALCFSLLFLCATQLQNITAGIFAVMFGLAIAPLHTMGRLVNFYPTIIAVMLFGCFCFAYWTKKSDHFRTLLLGCAIGALFLIDLRGVLWACIYWFGSIIWILFQVPKRKWPSTLLLLHIPIIIAWNLGPWAYPPNTTPIEQQTSFVYKEFVPGRQHMHNKKLEGYVWGRTGVYSIVELFIYLFEQTQKELPASSSQFNARDKFNFDSNMNVLLAYSIIPCLLLRHPRRVYTFVICLLPFGLAWKGITDAKDFQLRLYAQAAPLIALSGGVAVGAWKDLIPLKVIRFPRILFIGAVFGLSYGIMMGRPSNPFSLGQSWHPNWFPRADELNRINELVLADKGVKIRDDRMVQCYEQISTEKQPWVRTYAYIYKKLKPLKPPTMPRK